MKIKKNLSSEKDKFLNTVVMKKILVFGGSFNPIHDGHIKIALRAADELSADRIIIVPTGRSGYKSKCVLASREDRLNMCRLAVDGTGIEISTLELDRDEQSYTYQTVAKLKKEYSGSKLYFLCGSDMFLTLHTWRAPDKIFDSASIAVALRGNDERDDLLNYKQKYFPNEDIVFVNIGKIDISSTEIRESLKCGKRPVGINPKVYAYIQKKRLYEDDN